jgi:hypothetical protein
MSHVQACPRIKVAKLGNLIPTKYLEALEHNQQIASCCRHPENHEIEAFKSHPDEKAPDIYIFTAMDVVASIVASALAAATCARSGKWRKEA